jgi:TPR repeat protein
MNRTCLVPSRSTNWRTTASAICGIALLTAAAPAWSVEAGPQALPPPVPFYSANVSKTTIVADGMIVIETKDPLDRVLGWYRANLRDQIADVPVGPGHHHFLTHNGAGVDVSELGTGGGAGTKIALLWKSGANGPYQSQPASPEAEKPPLKDNPAAEAETPKAQAQAASPPTPAPPAAEAPTPAQEPEPEIVAVVPTRIEPLKPLPAETRLAKMELPKPKLPEAAPQRAQRPPPRPAARTDNSPEDDPKIVAGEGLSLFRAGRYAEALLAWQDAAAAGNVNAALYVGMMYDTGKGVPQSYKEALSWYRMAAEKGSVEGYYNVGVLYDAGIGVNEDTAEASEWYSQAAAKGSGRAAFNLALLFEKGDGVPRDDASAARYFKQAERLGIAAARSHLRRPSPDGSGPDDDNRPFNTVHPLANDAPAGGSSGAARALERIRQLADKGEPAAQYDLAYCLENGIGVAIDLRQAYALYRRASEGTEDSRLRAVADAGAAQVEAHIAASVEAIAR